MSYNPAVADRIEVYSDFHCRRMVRIYGSTLNGKNGKPRKFKTDAAAIKAAETVIAARRAHIGM